MSGPSRADVAVVGGGIAGLASAWRLAQQGAAVQVFDPAPGSGASGVAAGMLAPVTEARLGEEHLLALGLASLRMWPGFAADLEAASGEAIGFRTDGCVVAALDSDDRALLADLADRQRSMGLAVEDLSGRELRRLEPALAPGVRRGVLAADERSVDAAAVVGALQAAVRAAGVEVRSEAVAGLDVDAGGRVRGVLAGSGIRVQVGTVVVAAGPWSAGLEGFPRGTRPPVRPVKGQLLTLRQRPGDEVVHHTVRGYARGSAVYLVPRVDGRLICGATVEERGWDAVVTAGAAYELLRDVLALFPGLDEAEIVGVRSGFRPGTPDDLPLLGPTGVDGLVMATGHYRNGILLAPVTAEAVVAAVTGTAPPAEVVPCDPGRFAVEEGVSP